MENRRERFRARSGIHLCTTLVLVSIGANPFFGRHNDRLLSPKLDLHARNYRLAKRVLGNECGMAALGNRASRISTGALGRQKAFWKCFLRRWNGKFRDRGSNREFRFADLRRRIAAAAFRPAGPDGICRLSKAHAKPDGHQLWIELWDPFLENFGGWVRPHLYSRPSSPPSWWTRCCWRLSLFAARTANDSSPNATNGLLNSASSGTRSSPEECLTTGGGKKRLTGASSRPWRWTPSRPLGRRNPRGC